MNVSLKSKKRAVLPSRPSPPSVDRILEDVGGAEPDDPVFAILQQPQHPGETGEAERTFQQCRRHADVKHQLQEVGAVLTRQRDHLRAAGQRLDRHLAEVKGGLC
ncbi:UPF0449 protein C19orf25 homolog [Hippocampus comes]|uniref:Si:ch73-238c9.1 n=1 Tax=Hippocampus comes TaxID=109280 RepID=A0A3Q2YTW5_HIPCM|nr:PREDICTED: UPF0449 protein C19orf25 homolog [Hippocampus comes]XP_019711356.1 PREDICTED: UPF0449 protein C19orf25 homolog [Hippocampus comes]XP_019711357.1 PREDICTED: UPF0449 protein C19orf25 homolog [Hippocampus comes]XP_019711358.1 PREDICTED: UPF0449 protein C19orf25 homolog [Hippocampus comes]